MRRRECCSTRCASSSRRPRRGSRPSRPGEAAETRLHAPRWSSSKARGTRITPSRPARAKSRSKFRGFLFHSRVLLHNGVHAGLSFDRSKSEALMGLSRLLPRPQTRVEDPDEPRTARGSRIREPERRRREDDDDAESGRRARRAGAARALRRPRSAGQPDDEPGAEPGRDRALDVRRARPPAADRAGDPQDARSTSPSRRSTSPAPSSRCRA